MRRRPQKETVKQPLPCELLDSLLEFIRVKFYQGFAVNFTKDRDNLLRWVIFYPAGYFNGKGVTITTARYGEILKAILMEAAAHGLTGKIRYIPAWLRMVVQSHFAHHGEGYYEEAKAIRNRVDAVMFVTGKIATASAPDVVHEFTAAARLLKTARKTQKPSTKPFLKAQLSLL